MCETKLCWTLFNLRRPTCRCTFVFLLLFGDHFRLPWVSASPVKDHERAAAALAASGPVYLCAASGLWYRCWLRSSLINRLFYWASALLHRGVVIILYPLQNVILMNRASVSSFHVNETGSGVKALLHALGQCLSGQLQRIRAARVRGLPRSAPCPNR